MKTTIKKILVPAIGVFILLTLITGCSNDDDIINSSHKFNTVNGKLTDYLGNGIRDVKVETKTSKTTTSVDGSFVFTNVIPPYDISVYTSGMTVITFHNINTTKPILPVEYINSEVLERTSVKIIIPQINNNQRALVKFYDTSGLYTNETTFSNETSCELDIQWCGNQSIPGKMVLWIYTYNNSNGILSYDKYGEKPLTVSNNIPGRLIFADIDLNTNPVESNMVGNIQFPEGFQISNMSIGMNRYPFATLDSYGKFTGNVNVNGANFSVFMPFLNGDIYNYYCYLSIQSLTDGKSGAKLSEITFRNYNYISFNTIPSLVYPDNKAQNVNYNTTFKFSKDSPNGIYYVTMQYFAKGYYVNRYIYMDNVSFNLSALLDTTYNICDNSECTWRVSKLTGFNKIDEFLSIPPAKNQKYREILNSELRTFKFKINK